MSRQGRPIYLDYQATTPLAPEALRAMRPYLEELFGNPHSPHLYGREADAAVETARAQVASVIDVASERLFRSEEHTSELQSLMRISYAVFCLKKKTRVKQFNN